MNHLEKYREKAKYTRAELADAAGVARQYIYKLENQSSVPTLTLAYAIAKILKKSVFTIWPDTTEIEVEKVEIRRVKK